MELLVAPDPLPDEVVGEAIDGERRVRWLNAALCVLNARELDILRERRRAGPSPSRQLQGGIELPPAPAVAPDLRC